MNKNQLKGLINEVMVEMAKESLKSKLKEIISESIKEIKVEDENSLVQDMEEVDKLVKEYHKSCDVVKDDKGNYNISNIPPHHFSIRPMYAGIYDVVYFKDSVDRTKKLNLNIKDLKEFIKSILDTNTLNYVDKSYNRCAENDKDQVEKSENPRHDILTKKEVSDKKNDNKDYNEFSVKDEDLPNKPMRDSTKFKKQNEHPIKGTKPEYKQPKLDKKESKLVIKQKSKGKLKKLG